MSRLFYFVAPSEAQGVKEAAARGWERIARCRFVTPGKDDVRLVWRLNDLHPLAGVTPMVKAAGYEEALGDKSWVGGDEDRGEKARFDGFVEGGYGEWVELS